MAQSQPISETEGIQIPTENVSPSMADELAAGEIDRLTIGYDSNFDESDEPKEVTIDSILGRGRKTARGYDVDDPDRRVDLSIGLKGGAVTTHGSTSLGSIVYLRYPAGYEPPARDRVTVEATWTRGRYAMSCDTDYIIDDVMESARSYGAVDGTARVVEGDVNGPALQGQVMLRQEFVTDADATDADAIGQARFPDYYDIDDERVVYRFALDDGVGGDDEDEDEDEDEDADGDGDDPGRPMTDGGDGEGGALDDDAPQEIGVFDHATESVAKRGFDSLADAKTWATERGPEYEAVDGRTLVADGGRRNSPVIAAFRDAGGDTRRDHYATRAPDGQAYRRTPVTKQIGDTVAVHYRDNDGRIVYARPPRDDEDGDADGDGDDPGRPMTDGGRERHHPEGSDTPFGFGSREWLGDTPGAFDDEPEDVQDLHQDAPVADRVEAGDWIEYQNRHGVGQGKIRDVDGSGVWVTGGTMQGKRPVMYDDIRRVVPTDLIDDDSVSDWTVGDYCRVVVTMGSGHGDSGPDQNVRLYVPGIIARIGGGTARVKPVWRGDHGIDEFDVRPADSAVDILLSTGVYRIDLDGGLDAPGPLVGVRLGSDEE